MAGKNILLIRLSCTGDVVHALPVARAVRESYPGARISWLAERPAAELAAANPYIDRVIVLPKKEWNRGFVNNKIGTLREIRRFYRKLGEYDFDIALDMQGRFKSGLSAYLSGARTRAGPSWAGEGSAVFYNKKITSPHAPDRRKDVFWKSLDMHVVERNLYMAGWIGARGSRVSFDIVPPPPVKARAREIIKNLPPSRKVIALHPFTTWKSKDWPPGRYAKLADAMIREFDCAVLYTGSSEDREGISRIIEMMERPAENTAGELGLLELAGLYRVCDLFIGGDTGPMHLAVAVGTGVLAIMGPTTARTHGPFGEKHKVIQKASCRDCWMKICPKKTYGCMREISVREVLSAAGDMVKGAGAISNPGARAF